MVRCCVTLLLCIVAYFCARFLFVPSAIMFEDSQCQQIAQEIWAKLCGAWIELAEWLVLRAPELVSRV